MTEEKALEQLKYHEYWTTYSWQDEVCEIAIKALEKQIPKKPIPQDRQHIRYSMNYTCPSCGKCFSGTGIADYCYHCGQALDWG